MKNQDRVNYFSTEKFLKALIEAFKTSQNVYDKACDVDKKLGIDSVEFNKIIDTANSFFEKKLKIGELVDKKHKLMPYGRVCLNLSSPDSLSVLDVAISLAITYNSGQIYCWKLDNYAVNLYIITIINGVLKRFLALNYIAYQIGEAPKLVKYIFYIERADKLYFFEKLNKEPLEFEPNCLLTRSKI